MNYIDLFKYLFVPVSYSGVYLLHFITKMAGAQQMHEASL